MTAAPASTTTPDADLRQKTQFFSRHVGTALGTSLIGAGSTAELFIKNVNGDLFRLAQEGEKFVLRNGQGTGWFIAVADIQKCEVKKGSRLPFPGPVDSPVETIEVRTVHFASELKDSKGVPSLADAFWQKAQSAYQALARRTILPDVDTKHQASWKAIEKNLDFSANLSSLPAHKILQNQVDKIFDNSKAENPNFSTCQLSCATAARFLSVGMYQRIAEQRMFGISAAEAHDGEAELSQVVGKVNSDLRGVLIMPAKQDPW